MEMVHSDFLTGYSPPPCAGAPRDDGKDYLSSQHGFALHRMATISYGETAPVASNDTRDERALNRRVALVVLQ